MDGMGGANPSSPPTKWRWYHREAEQEGEADGKGDKKGNKKKTGKGKDDEDRDDSPGPQAHLAYQDTPSRFAHVGLMALLPATDSPKVAGNFLHHNYVIDTG